MNEERTGGIPKGTVVDRGGYIGPQGRINTELVRPPESSHLSDDLATGQEQVEPVTEVRATSSTENPQQSS